MFSEPTSSTMSETAQFYLDHEIVFIATCSSFITLLILSLMNQCHFIKINYYKTQQFRKAMDNFETDDDYQEVEESEDYKEEEEKSDIDIEQLTENMIVPNFYIHATSPTYFQSNEYLEIIPKNSDWIHSNIKLLHITPSKGGEDSNYNYSERLHQIMIRHFNVSMIEPASNNFLSELNRGISLFQEWNKWKNNGDGVKTGWKYHATKNKMNVYTHIFPNSQLQIVKAEMVLPYNAAIVCGALANLDILMSMDPAIEAIDDIQHLSLSSDIIHLRCKCPFPLSNRDFISVSFMYLFKDGSVLCGSTAVADDDKERLQAVESLIDKTKYKPSKYVRGMTTMSLYHFRPDYDNNIQNTRITYYSHMSMSGNIPSWMLNNFATMEIAAGLLNVGKCIKKNFKNFHKPGILNIMPNPFGKMMGLC